MSSGLISISPIYDYLVDRGCQPRGEAIVIAGWPVQFLPVYDPLTEEAVARAAEVNFGQTLTRVLTPEHLAAIMLATARPKDHARLIQFFECNALDQNVLADIVERHGLTSKWRDFQRRFLIQDD